MKTIIAILALATLAAVPSLAQGIASTGQDSGTGTNQAAQPKGGTTLIGCLSGPDRDGKFILYSMEHRTGVEVFGSDQFSDELKADSGGKVKLTGSWKPADQAQAQGAKSGGTKKERRFEATQVELMAEACQNPSEKTPVSMKKQQQEQQKQKQKAAASVPASGDTSNPKP